MSEAQMAQISELTKLCADLIKSTEVLGQLSGSDSLYASDTDGEDITSAWDRAIAKSREAETAMVKKWNTMSFVPEGGKAQMTEAIKSAKSMRECQPSVVTWQSLQRSEE